MKIKEEIASKLLKRVCQQPFVYFWIISVILLGLTSFGLRIILSPSDNQEGFFSANVFKAFNQDEQMFLSSIEKVLLESPDLLLVQGNSIQAVSPSNIISPQVLGALFGGGEIARQAIIEYTVRSGDSLSVIADRFNISINTITWANNLRGTVIRPGQRLIILPVSGVKHIVKEGDTISEISERYNVKAEEIISFNLQAKRSDEKKAELSFNNLDGESISVGQVLIIPGGTKPTTLSAVMTANIDISGLTPRQVRAKFSTNNYWGQSHSFPFGQCTWWVAQKRAIGRWGNAIDWLSNAERDGLRVCRGRNCAPIAGAVIIVRGHPIFGHVAYVEGVRGSEIIFSEMNKRGCGTGRINKRSVGVGSSSIIGFIY